jgi:salicylate hydroxylase
MLEHPPAPFYNSGSIAMMGDAAHATTPFQGAGAGQAIEDALVISKLLGYVKTPSHIAPALAAYDVVRRDRSQKVVLTSREAIEQYGLENEVVNGDKQRWSDLWGQRMKWIWDIDLVKQNDLALKIFAKAIPTQPNDDSSVDVKSRDKILNRGE